MLDLLPTCSMTLGSLWYFFQLLTVVSISYFPHCTQLLDPVINPDSPPWLGRPLTSWLSPSRKHHTYWPVYPGVSPIGREPLKGSDHNPPSPQIPGVVPQLNTAACRENKLLPYNMNPDQWYISKLLILPINLKSTLNIGRQKEILLKCSCCGNAHYKLISAN